MKMHVLGTQAWRVRPLVGSSTSPWLPPGSVMTLWRILPVIMCLASAAACGSETGEPAGGAAPQGGGSSEGGAPPTGSLCERACDCLSCSDAERSDCEGVEAYLVPSETCAAVAPFLACIGARIDACVDGELTIDDDFIVDTAECDAEQEAVKDC